jgi:DNA polymerase I
MASICVQEDEMSAEQSRLVLIDGHALAYRAYFALANTEMRTRGGEATHAVYGFISMLLSVWHELHPEYIACTFDVGETFRHARYKEYKATREKSPADMEPQVKRIQQVLEAFNIPIFTAQNYEADDVLGTLANQAAGQGIDTVIVTGDRDAFQLIRPGIRVLISGRRFQDREIYDEAGVENRYGLPPSQLVDLKALTGDTSDNIPGVKGIGDKTGAKLLQTYGNLENIYQHLAELGAALQTKLQTDRENAFLSQELGRIITEVPAVTLDLEKCRARDYNAQKVHALFRDLEFRSLLNRLPESGHPLEAAVAPEGQLTMFTAPTEAKVAAPPSAEERETVATAIPAMPQPPAFGDYQAISDEAGLDAMLAVLRTGSVICLDTETTGVNPLAAELVGISLSCNVAQAYYLPVGHVSEFGAPISPQLPLELILKKLQPLLGDPDKPKIGHNLKYDILVLQRHGLIVRGELYDTMVASFLINPGGSHGLKSLAWSYLQQEMTEITELIGKNKKQITMAQVPVERATPYACADVDMTLRLMDILTARMHELDQWSLFANVEMKLLPVLVRMELAGIKLDTQALHAYSVDLAARLHEIEKEIYKLIGYSFNINSTQQMSDVLFGKLGLSTEGLKKTSSGFYSTAADVLEGFRGRHPVIDLILDYRQLQKLKSTYVDTLPKLVDKSDGRLHTSYNQIGAVTGRLSSSDPNLQNIPIRTEEGRRVRRAFVAEKGNKLISADYSQVELRIMAHIADDAGLKAAFARGEDIHASTAAAVLGIPLPEVTKDQRRIAKSINFGLAYGQTAFGLAQATGLSRGEAEAFIRTYFEKYPAVRTYIERTKALAAEKGYVETLLGRRRYFPNLKEQRGPERGRLEREAINHPIQGTAADIIKLAMIQLQAELEKRRLKARMLLQVHDELVLECPLAELEEAAELTSRLMSEALPKEASLSVPLKVDVEVGENWLEMETI